MSRKSLILLKLGEFSGFLRVDRGGADTIITIIDVYPAYAQGQGGRNRG